MGSAALRSVRVEDLDQFFAHQLGPQAVRVAAFTGDGPTDPASFAADWQRKINDPAVTARTITVEDDVVGGIVSYPGQDGPEVAFWVARRRWGQGIASRALAAFVDEVPERPLHARAATDNAACLTVLQRCGFTVVGRQQAFAPGRDQVVEECLLTLAD